MSSDYSDMPLPPNWESKFDTESGHWFVLYILHSIFINSYSLSRYYINHEAKTTSWDDPRPAYYSAQQIDRLNTYIMGFGERQDLISEFFDVPEISPKSRKNSKSVNRKPCDDRSKDSSVAKTHRGRSEPRGGDRPLRKDTYFKGRNESSRHNRESRSSTCSQNDNQSYHSSTCVSPTTNKKLACDSLLSKALTDNDVDGNVFTNEPVEKVDIKSQIYEQPLQIDNLTNSSLKKCIDTANSTITATGVITTGNNPSIGEQPLNIASTYSSNIVDLNLYSTEKSHRYQPIGPNCNLLGSRIIPHGSNPLLVHGPNPSLVHGSMYK
ncbi:hypothetical protein MN116_007290 [Schistosoma mekongi]|uniref:WW domain-containing protein n=1 Tax=Schistosoma mekongi TaxID=38744 RepID=A0AAE1Z910_SCHME|nr:hypothetical protein MN116_007290 [Schistosoma mekongi]